MYHSSRRIANLLVVTLVSALTISISLAQTNPGLQPGVHHNPTEECGAPPIDGGAIICSNTTYSIPYGETFRNNISYWLHGPKDTNYDYTITIDGSSLGELRYLTGDTSIEGGVNNDGRPSVIDIHGGEKYDGTKVTGDDSLSDMDLTVNVRNVVIDTTKGNTVSRMAGILSVLDNSSGDLRLNVQNSSVTSNFQAIFGLHDGAGDLFIDVTDSTLTAKEGRTAVDGYHQEFGDVTILVRDSTVTAEKSIGIRGFIRHRDQWKSTDTNQPRSTDSHDIRIITENVTILTEGHHRYRGYGIYARNWNYAGTRTGNAKHPNTKDVHGDLIVDLKDSEVTTEGANDHGVFSYHEGKGNIIINLRDTHIWNKGDSSNSGLVGLWGHNPGDGGFIDISVDGGSIRTPGTETGDSNRAVGIRLTGVNKKDSEGYVRQTARINGLVSAGYSGVYFSGGGRLYIGPRGVISGGDSGVITRGNNAKFLVSIDLAGRTPSTVLNGPIVNTRGSSANAILGTTVLVINDVIVFDGVDDSGLTGNVVPIGINNLVLRSENLTTTESALWISLDNIATAPAERGGVYESLPAFLTSLNSQWALSNVPPEFTEGGG